MTELPQRKLAVELRIAIDRAMRSPQQRWYEAIAKLIYENPNGWGSSHVTHNVGEARRAFVAQLLASPRGRSLLDMEAVKQDKADKRSKMKERHAKARAARRAAKH